MGQVAINTNLNTFLEEKVGYVGKSLSVQSSQVYQPVDQPFGGSVQTEKCTDLLDVPTSVSKVGTIETPTTQGFQGSCTDLPTKNAKNGNSDAMPLQVGDRIVDIRTSEIGTIRSLPEIGITWIRQSHLVEYDDGHESYVALCHLVRYGD